jgi:SAM-dependent methyltransferase
MAEVPNGEQAKFWNEGPGQVWVRHQADLDALHAGVLTPLMEASTPRAGEAVLDVGCGAGASSFALARAVGPEGLVLGVDISAPLVRRAEGRRAEEGLGNVAFEIVDAQVHRFEAQRYDLVASRFGMMFFDNPVVAFENLRAALRPGGRIVFVAWAGPEENPWFAWPQRIAEARLGAGASSSAEAPGPMAFRNVERVCSLLARGGFSEPQGEEIAVDLHLSGGIPTALALITHLGPVARLLREKQGTDADRAAIAAETAAAFAPFIGADGLRVPARINVLRAVAGGAP